MEGLIALAGLAVAVPLAAYWVSHNRLVAARNEVATSWAGVDVELTRRHQLIPELVTAVQAAAAHERGLLVELSSRNDAAAGAHTAGEANRWEPPLASAVAQVVALRERYPALNSQQNFLDLQQRLAATEDRIAAARRFYNTRVEEYNRRTEAFPSRWVAHRHDFHPADFFDL